jgi:hypothetical protein
MPEGHHCTRTGHPLSVGGYFLWALMISKIVVPFKLTLSRMRPTGIPNAPPTRFARFCRPKEIKDLRAAPYVAVFRPCRRISSGPSSCSERPGLAVDARAVGSDLAALTSAYDLSDPKCKEIWR